MPWYSVTISATDALAGKHTRFEELFDKAFIAKGRPNMASLWCRCNAEDGSIIYFLTRVAFEISKEEIATFSPVACKEPSLVRCELLQYQPPLTLEGDNEQ